jgi:hypothetical protein
LSGEDVDPWVKPEGGEDEVLQSKTIMTPVVET